MESRFATIHGRRRQARQDDEHAGHPVDPLVRRDAAAQGSGVPEGQPEGHVHHGPRRQHRDPHAGGCQGRREARPAGRRRSGADHLGRALGNRKDNTYLLPAATSYEVAGSRTASNRSIQWGEQIVKPIFESKDDNEIMYRLATKLGFADKMFKNIKVENNVPVAEDILREINRGGCSTGYCGQSPERLKLHMANQKDFDLVTLQGERRAGQGRLLRPAVAVLGHAGAQAPGHPHPLQHQPARDGRWRHVPRPLRRGARRQDQGNGGRQGGGAGGAAQPAGRRLLLAGLGDPGRISGVHLRRAQEARLGRGPDRGRAGNHRAHRRRQSRCRLLGDRSVGRHPARVPQARRACTTATARRGPTRSDCPMRCRCTASRSTRRGRNSLPSIRRCPTRASSACPTWASTCRRRRWRRASPRSSR